MSGGARSRPLGSILTLAAVLLSGCGAEAGTARFEGVVLERVAEYGCVECEGAELFGSIASVAATPRGRIAVLTFEPPRVRLFDLSGDSALAFGASGDGPGELRFALGMAALADGGVLVVGSRDVLFDGRGRYVRELPRTGSGGPGFEDVVASPSGEWLLRFERSGWPDRTLHLRILDGGLRPHASLEVPRQVWAADEDPSEFVLGHAISDDGVVALGSGRGEYRIVFLLPSGEVTAAAERRIAPPERTEEEIEALRSAFSGTLGPDAPLRPISTTRPHFNAGSFRFDAAGRLWVRTFRGDSARTFFDVFDPGGRYLGEVELPGRIADFHIAGDLLVAHVLGELDVAGVEVWRMRSGR